MYNVLESSDQISNAIINSEGARVCEIYSVRSGELISQFNSTTYVHSFSRVSSCLESRENYVIILKREIGQWKSK